MRSERLSCQGYLRARAHFGVIVCRERCDLEAQGPHSSLCVGRFCRQPASFAVGVCAKAHRAVVPCHFGSMGWGRGGEAREESCHACARAMVYTLSALGHTRQASGTPLVRERAGALEVRSMSCAPPSARGPPGPRDDGADVERGLGTEGGPQGAPPLPRAHLWELWGSSKPPCGRTSWGCPGCLACIGFSPGASSKCVGRSVPGNLSVYPVRSPANTRPDRRHDTSCSDKILWRINLFQACPNAPGDGLDGAGP